MQSESLIYAQCLDNHSTDHAAINGVLVDLQRDLDLNKVKILRAEMDDIMINKKNIILKSKHCELTYCKQGIILILDTDMLDAAGRIALVSYYAPILKSECIDSRTIIDEITKFISKIGWQMNKLAILEATDNLIKMEKSNNKSSILKIFWSKIREWIMLIIHKIQ